MRKRVTHKSESARPKDELIPKNSSKPNELKEIENNSTANVSDTELDLQGGNTASPEQSVSTAVCIREGHDSNMSIEDFKVIIMMLVGLFLIYLGTRKRRRRITIREEIEIVIAICLLCATYANAVRML